MFEVGKRYRAIETFGIDYVCGVIIKDEIYLLIEEDGIYGNWKDSKNKINVGFGKKLFDPTPVSEPRMVTTCDIGARVVRVKMSEESGDCECPIGRTITVKKIDLNNTFQGVETGWWYKISDFMPVLTKSDFIKGNSYKRIGNSSGYPNPALRVKIGDIAIFDRIEDSGRLNFGQVGYNSENPEDFVLADEQPKTDAENEHAKPSIDIPCVDCHEYHDPDMQCKAPCPTCNTHHHVDDDCPKSIRIHPTNEGVAAIVRGGKPTLCYAANTWKGPTKEEKERAKNVEEEKKRYENH